MPPSDIERHPSGICLTCITIHDRDTTRPVQCPHCGRVVGCFWHPRWATRHIGECSKLPCPECGGPRRWENVPGGGLDRVCDNCGYRGAHDDRKRAELFPHAAIGDGK